MRRLSQDEGWRVPARIADEAGYTLVELLVTMVVGLIVLGGGTFGLSLAFRQSNEITARAATNSTAEAGLERLTSDIRTSVACPSYVSGSSTYYPALTNAGVPSTWAVASASTNAVVAVYVGGTAAYPILAMCDPAPGAAITTPPQTDLVIWNCQQTTENCARTFQTLPTAPSASNQAYGTAEGTGGIYGVGSLALSGVVGGVSATTLPTGSYALGSGITGAAALSWLGISGSFFNLVNPGNPSASVNLQFPATKTIAINTGAALRNYRP